MGFFVIKIYNFNHKNAKTAILFYQHVKTMQFYFIFLFPPGQKSIKLKISNICPKAHSILLLKSTHHKQYWSRPLFIRGRGA